MLYSNFFVEDENAAFPFAQSCLHVPHKNPGLYPTGTGMQTRLHNGTQRSWLVLMYRMKFLMPIKKRYQYPTDRHGWLPSEQANRRISPLCRSSKLQESKKPTVSTYATIFNLIWFGSVHLSHGKQGAGTSYKKTQFPTKVVDDTRWFEVTLNPR